MKKRIVLVLLALLLLTLPCLAQAATTARLNQRIATRSGPGTKYFEPGSFLSAGDYVTVHTRVWDSVNEIWWVQVEFQVGYDRYRAYTGSWRMNVDLSSVPQECMLRTCTVRYDADAFAGPGLEYVLWNDTVYSGTSATLYEVENGWGLIECWNSRKGQYWRVWVRLSDLSCGSSYSDWDDTYSDNYYHGPGGINITGGTDSGGSWFIGETCVIIANPGNARSGAGADYSFAGYVYRGERYYIYDTAEASNGRTWFKIKLDSGRYAWISSGITTVNGVTY